MGLKCIHEKNLIRGNLHEGDVLVEVVDGEYIDTKIVDTGLHGPFDINPQQTYGIVPFIAPEIFTNKRIKNLQFGNDYVDIIYRSCPCYDKEYDSQLIKDTTLGLRPSVVDETQFNAQIS